MEGKIFGIPLVLILLVFFIAILVDVPMVLLYSQTQKEVLQVRTQQLNTDMNVQRLLVTPTVEPTATPSATPILKTFRPVATPHVTTQVK